MELNVFATRTIECIKDCRNLIQKNSLQSVDKVVVSIFTNFLKVKVFSGYPPAKNCLDDFESDFNNQRFEGRLEVWLQVALTDKPDLQEDLNNKILEIQSITQKLNAPPTVEPISKPIEKTKEEIRIPIASEKNSETTVNQTKAEPKPGFKFEANNLKNVLLIPTDFSEVAEVAFLHALWLSDALHAEIVFLHCAKKGKERIVANNRFQVMVNKLAQNVKKEFRMVFKEESLGEAIKQTVEEQKITMIILGTAKKSNVNLLVDSVVPYFVVQQAPQKQTIREIVFPIDSRIEVKKELLVVKFLSLYFSVHIQLITQGNETARVLAERMANNVNFIKSFLTQNNISFDYQVVENTSDWAEATNRFCKTNPHDLILVLPHSNLGIRGIVITSETLSVINDNPKVPIICVDPVHNKSVGFTTGVIY